MAVHLLLKRCLRSCPKLGACFYTLRCNVHTKVAETIEELENVYNERKCFINGKLLTATSVHVREIAVVYMARLRQCKNFIL